VEVLRIDANSHELDERRRERQERSQNPDDEESMSAPDGAAEPGQQQKGCRKINRERDPELLRDEKCTHAEQDELKKSSAHEPTRRASTGNDVCSHDPRGECRPSDQLQCDLPEKVTAE